MEQLNTILPKVQEDKEPAVEATVENRQEQLLLNKVRQKFEIFGGISFIFGSCFTLLFYKTWIGINVLIFSLIMIFLILAVMKNLMLPVKTGTKFYFAGVVLLGVSTSYTSNNILQFLNIIGMLFLLDLSLLHQMNEDHQWSFIKNIKQMFFLLFSSIASIGMPIIDSYKFFKKSKILKNNRSKNIIVGVLVSIPMLLLTTALLSHADLLFGRLTSNIFSGIFSSNLFGVIFMTLFGFIACYCILCSALYKEDEKERKPIEKADATIAITFMTLLCAVYMLFCGIQLVYLFANGLFALPNGFTFAEYARRGFFELLAVTVINIVIMLLCTTAFQDNKFLRLLLSCMTVCTYIMIISATYRMYLYITAYHLTFLRLFVLLTLFIDAFVLAGVLIYVYNKNFLLFRYCVVVVSVCYITFTFTRPDYCIASYLVAQNEKLNLDDMRYLTQNLSLDAAPVVLTMLKDSNRWDIEKHENRAMDYDGELLEEDYNETFEDYVTMYYDRISYVKNNTGIKDFNYSNNRAASIYDSAR